MKPNFVAKKSVVPVLSFWLILFFWLIIPLIIQIVRIVKAKNDIVEFYDDKVIYKSGILSKYEKKFIFGGVYSVNMSQSVFGRMFKYGDLAVDFVGDFSVPLNGVKNFYELKNYLESKMVEGKKLNARLVK